MRRPNPILPLAFSALVLVGGPLHGQGTPIGFAEDFALAADREAVLDKLIPGTEEAYFYRCLHLQNEGRLDEVPPLLAQWIERHGRRGRVHVIENRQALLDYERDPAATYEHLRRRLGLRFDHERQVSGARPELPTRLDQGLIAPDTLTRRALQRHPGSLEGFRDSGLPALVRTDLDADLLHELLARLERPDLPGLVVLVLRDLQRERGPGFGSIPLHGKLLLEQLEECARQRPTLLEDPTFVATWIERLHPGEDVDWRSDARERLAYLDRLEAFTQRLAPVHDSLKAHVLYHRLAHDLQQGAPDKQRLLAYLRLPRQASYVNPELVRRGSRSGGLVDLSRDYPTGLDAVGNDEPLVRAWLMHFFREENDWRPYAELLREDWLRRLFAETKLLAGQGDLTQWTALVEDPGWLEALKRRVEIEFAPTQPTRYRADAPVTLEVDVKNVETLLVKVFEIDTFNYYRAVGREVDASIALDGLVANEERSLTLEQSPLRRVRQRLELDSLARPGVYVVELIGNGLSSRAVIHKGGLQLGEASGSAGQVLRVLDEDGRHVRDATVWLAGREYRPDGRGEIVLPFSTEPGRKPILLRHGELTTLAQLDHRAETYSLAAAVYTPRESLLSRRRARLVVRPTLTVDGRPVPPELLEDPVLAISSVDGQGVGATQEARDLELSAAGELVHELQVPEGLTSLSVVLRGKVRSLSQGVDLDLSSPPTELTLNAMDATTATWAPLLGRSDGGWLLDVRGKNGEPKIDRAVDLTLELRDFTDALHVTLRTDERGRVELGALEGVTDLSVAGLPGGYGAWDLRGAARTWPRRVHGVAGQTLRVPYVGRATSATREVVSLLELRDGSFARDAFAHVAIAGGFVELDDLAPGNYSLWLAEERRQIEVAVTAGEVRDGWAFGRDRHLELPRRAPLQVVELGATEGRLSVRLVGAAADTRVHVFATRYLPAFDPFQHVAAPWQPWLDARGVDHPESSYHSGREVGDEYRYILERRLARRFPGNMLPRPGVLLNPWALEETDAGIGVGGGAGGRFGGRAARSTVGAGGGAGGAFGGRSGLDPGTWPDLDFLPRPARLIANLRPDADGLVSVPLADLGEGQLVHVLAVDPEATVYRTLALAEQPLEPDDRRLASPLDPARAFAEQKQVELVAQGATSVIEDVASSSAQTYDSLASVYRLFRTLSGNADLDRFAFLLGWPELEPDQKRALYSEHACHELHVFLWHKDPAFFAEVVRPYLANKADKTFLDHWLLEDDLAAFLDPYLFERLNIVERILLTGRLQGRREDGVRHVRELLALVPRDPERARRLFDAALGGAALETETGLGSKLVETRERLRAELPDQRAAEDKALDDELMEAGRTIAPAARAPAEEPAAGEELGAAEFFLGKGEEQEVAAGLELELERRKGVRALYRAPDRTRAYVESNYWHVPIEQQDADLVGVNAFWRDYAERDPAQPFLSLHFAEAAGSLTEMLLALAVLDLPFQAGEHAVETEGARLRLTAASPLLLVRKDVLESQPATDEPPLLVSQNLVRLDDRWRFDEDGTRREAYVGGELVVDVPYACQVVVTNPTSAPRRLSLLLQIPEGSLPLSGGFRTRSVEVELAAFSTHNLEYAFYFPAPGSFRHYPVHASRGGRLVAAADARAVTVVPVPTSVDTTSWQHVSQMGTSEEVIAYLERANLQRLDLDLIAWRLRDRAFYERVLPLLRRRLAWAAVPWSYGILHRDALTTRGYLRQQGGFLAQCGRWLDSALVSIDPVERRTWQIVEFEPLFNARAHPFAGRREILDRGLASQYLDLLDVLAYRPRLDDDDRMAVTYYLLLQDRVAEALDQFAQVDPARLATRVQYDYMRAYMDFFSDDHAIARAVAEPYRQHPVERWRQRFGEVLRQLDEAEGRATAGGDEDDRTRSQTDLAQSEPALELSVEAGRVRLAQRNLERCELRYYPMDVEFQFSTSPFARQDEDAAVYVRALRTDVVTLEPDGETVLDLPAELASANLLVEVRGGGLVRRQACYASSLDVRTLESYGQVVVASARSGQPLSRVYVKVYARTSRGVRFHKDGYTDLRGRFDYASLTGANLETPERFAILVLSDSDGAALREVAPPLQ